MKKWANAPRRFVVRNYKPSPAARAVPTYFFGVMLTGDSSLKDDTRYAAQSAAAKSPIETAPFKIGRVVDIEHLAYLQARTL